ncbi:MAG TPA: ATP-binding protein [Clostridia bacterium]|nr:ATP-binding protein [Clostridia bacterium]
MSNEQKPAEAPKPPSSSKEERHSLDFDHDSTLIKMSVTIPARVEAISAAVEGIIAVVRTIDCASGKDFEIETALREALANAITHGCHNDPDKQVQCCVACQEEHGMLIIVRDPGQGFDPLAIPNPTIGENLYDNHGRGIYLINELMDEVRFERGGTEIHMRKY